MNATVECLRNSRTRSSRQVRSTVSILAGFATVVLLSVATDTALEKLDIFPSQNEAAGYVWWMYAVALVYRSMYAVAGGYSTAALAPDRPVQHAVILGTVGFVIGALGTVANWGKVSASNIWYPTLLVLVSVPFAWMGGKLESR